MDEVTTLRHFTKPELANFLAAKAVAAAGSFLDGRGDAVDLSLSAASIDLALGDAADAPAAREIVDATRLLVTAMAGASRAQGARAERWADVMRACIPLLRLESTELARTGAQRQ